MARRGEDGGGGRRCALLLLFISALTVAIAVTGCTSLNEPPQTAHVAVRDLFFTPERFDDRFVAVTGRASAPRVEFSGARSRQVFRLDDGAQAIEVRSLVGLGACPPLQPVTVEGWFRATGRGLGSGVIEAVRVVCRKKSARGLSHSTDDRATSAGPERAAGRPAQVVLHGLVSGVPVSLGAPGGSSTSDRRYAIDNDADLRAAAVKLAAIERPKSGTGTVVLPTGTVDGR